MRNETALIAVLAASLPLLAHAGTVKNIHKTLPLGANGAVSIETHNGGINVLTWNQSAVDIEARIEAGDSDYPEDVEKTTVRISSSGNDVHIASDYTGVGEHALGWFGFGSERVLPPVYYTVRMPATARLNIDDHNATVKVAGLHSDLTIRSHNGSVEVRDLDGAADIGTHNGDVRLAFARFAHAATIETHNGSCDVRLPAATRFSIAVDAHRSDPVDSEFALARAGAERSSYSADINGGGPRLRFSTHNGSLHLGKN
jgi:hypothetical protein